MINADISVFYNWSRDAERFTTILTLPEDMNEQSPLDAERLSGVLSIHTHTFISSADDISGPHVFKRHTLISYVSLHTQTQTPLRK